MNVNKQRQGEIPSKVGFGCPLILEENATADGTVEGLTSLSPNMTLYADTEGVILNLEYNRDINIAFAELEQVIISLGGNI